MTRLRGLAVRQVRYTLLGLRLGGAAVDWRSRLLLALLGVVALVKQRTHWNSRPLKVTIRIKDRIFPIHVSGRIDLEVLREILLKDEYGPSDDIEAKVIIDLGAHVGFATLRMLAARPDAQVVAVEADPLLLCRLRANVRHLPVTVVHAAVCGMNGQRTFFRSETSSWGNSLTRTVPWQEAHSVPACTLEDLLDRYGIENADLVKMDIEGAEWEVLGNGVPGRVKSLIGELHALDGRTPDELVSRIEESMQITITRAGADRVVFIATRDEPDS